MMVIIKTTGISVDEMKSEILQISKASEHNDYSIINERKSVFLKLEKYYKRQYKLLQGYEKNPQKLKESSDFIISWIEELKVVLSYTVT